MQNRNNENINSFKRVQIALSGAMIALSSATIGYMFMGFYGGLSFVVLVFGVLWFAQIQLESALDTIEIEIINEKEEIKKEL